MKFSFRFFLRVTLFVFAFSTATFARADKILPVKAQQVAARFLNSGSTARFSSSQVTLSWDSSDLRKAGPQVTSSDPLFYVFESASGNGFVIISGDDLVYPVIGYSFDGPAPLVENLPANLEQWLVGLSDAIRQIRNQGGSASADIAAQWKMAAPGNAVTLLETALWNQSEPYNDQCPMDGAQRSVTGCTATATATVMRYHRFPAHGTGVSEAYVTQTKNIQVPSRNLNHPIIWDNLLLDYSNGYTSEQAAEVASLMADIGALYQSDYAFEGTGAVLNVVPLYEHFGYSRNMRVIDKDGYPSEEWQQMIKEELDGNGPLIYRGANSQNAGHAFVLDGYTDNDYFHFNFGWGGAGNGYFLLDPLGDGIEAELMEFYRNQSFIQNFIPDEGGTEIDNWIQIYDPGLVADTQTFETGKIFSVPELWMINNSTLPFSGTVKIVQTDAQGNERYVHYSESRLGHIDIEPRYITGFRNLKFTLPENSVNGDLICMYYKADGSTQWRRMEAWNTSIPCEIRISLSSGTPEVDIENTTSIHYEESMDRLTVSYLEGVTAQLLCDGTASSVGVTVQPTQMTIDLGLLDMSKRYVLSLTSGTKVKEIVLNVRNLKK